MSRIGPGQYGTRAIANRPVTDLWSRLEEFAPFTSLAELPTPVGSLDAISATVGRRGDLWVKRDDATSPLYGGNKVRTLEVLFGRALREGATHVVSTGAFGSNHAVATAIHAPRIGISSGALLFPQPPSRAAWENLRVVCESADVVSALPHWSTFPVGIMLFRARQRRAGRRPFIMVPGGATPVGALGYVSAAFELGLQVSRGECPRPARIVLGVGSTCTSAGLLLGLRLAARHGLFVDASGRPRPPLVVSVRVTPWPVTSHFRVVSLALRTAELLAEQTGDRLVHVSRAELGPGLVLDGDYLGAGYGRPTEEGRRALDVFAEHGGPPLDTTYSAKSAASALDQLRAGAQGPILYWATKSSAPLPSVPDQPRAGTPARMQRWLSRARMGHEKMNLLTEVRSTPSRSRA